MEYPIDDLAVCLVSFRLTGTHGEKEHRCRCLPKNDGWGEAEWGRLAAGASVGRGKWRVLPLGRYSIMNGVAVDSTDDQASESPRQ